MPNAIRPAAADKGALSGDVRVIYILAMQGEADVECFMKVVLTPHESFIDDISVRKTFRGCGLSYGLFGCYCNFISSFRESTLSDRQVRLQVGLDNAVAARTYTKLTFNEFLVPRENPYVLSVDRPSSGAMMMSTSFDSLSHAVKAKAAANADKRTQLRFIICCGLTGPGWMPAAPAQEDADDQRKACEHRENLEQMHAA